MLSIGPCSSVYGHIKCLDILLLSLNFSIVITGDVAFRILESINRARRRALQDMPEDNLQQETQIFVCDINPNMLNVGKMRAQERGNVI